MKDMLKETPGGVLLKIRVVPGSGKFEIEKEDPWTHELKIKVKKPAREGGANRELVAQLGKVLERNIELIKGHKSRSKEVLVRDASLEELCKSLRGLTERWKG
jgi:uncharacterized protein (TIGR00251 family)